MHLTEKKPKNIIKNAITLLACCIHSSKSKPLISTSINSDQPAPPAKPHITASIWTPYVIDAGAEQSKLEHKIGCEFSMVSVYFT